MTIKSNNIFQAYFNRFGATGTDAAAEFRVYIEATGGIISDYNDQGPGKHYRACILYTSPSPRDS